MGRLTEPDSLFMTDKPIIFNFHGYPWLIHKPRIGLRATSICTCADDKEKGNIKPLNWPC